MTLYLASLTAAAVLFTVVAVAGTFGAIVGVAYVICELAGITGRKDK